MIDCETLPRVDPTHHLEDLFKKAWREHIPRGGSFDLTYRCNLRCAHCYAGPLPAAGCDAAEELDTAGWLRLLGEAAEAGCLFVVFSGGEPLIRRDFAEIYRGARRLGLVATLFTNATLVSDEHVRVLTEYPPRLIEVSLYGATEQTYRTVTGVAGAHARAMRGIERLVSAGLRVGLKTMILSENAHEIPAIRAVARSLGLNFRVDPLVIPRLDGDKDPLSQRVPPPDAVDLELEDGEARGELNAFAQRWSPEPSGYPIYVCSAGVNNFHLDPAGRMRACIMSRGVVAETAKRGFKTGWDAVGKQIQAINEQKPGVCSTCANISLCGYCPGLFELESGDASTPPDYVCWLGSTRRAMLDHGGG